MIAVYVLFAGTALMATTDSATDDVLEIGSTADRVRRQVAIERYLAAHEDRTDLALYFYMADPEPGVRTACLRALLRHERFREPFWLRVFLERSTWVDRGVVIAVVDDWSLVLRQNEFDTWIMAALHEGWLKKRTLVYAVPYPHVPSHENSLRAALALLGAAQERGIPLREDTLVSALSAQSAAIVQAALTHLRKTRYPVSERLLHALRKLRGREVPLAGWYQLGKEEQRARKRDVEDAIERLIEGSR